MPKRPCNEAGCPRYARPGSGKCDEHARQYERERSRRRRADATRGKAVELYHRKRWQATRKAVLARDPICKLCERRLSEQVDHIVPLSQGGDEWDLDNCQGVCARCHGIKSARESAVARGLAPPA